MQRSGAFVAVISIDQIDVFRDHDLPKPFLALAAKRHSGEHRSPTSPFRPKCCVGIINDQNEFFGWMRHVPPRQGRRDVLAVCTYIYQE